jgi:hypothetical protein
MSFDAIFQKHSIPAKGQNILTADGFYHAIKPTEGCPVLLTKEFSDLLFTFVASKKDFISRQDFINFEQILQKPHASYDILSGLINQEFPNGESVEISFNQLKLFLHKYSNLPKLVDLD